MFYHFLSVSYFCPFQPHAVSPEGGVRISPENETFNNTDNVTLNCITEGGPGNVFQWSFNGDELENETAELLNLTSVTAAEDGGIYSCFVSNRAGNDSYNTSLFISPMITSHPSDVNTTNGTISLSFSCTATAFPESQFMWFRERLPLPVRATGGNTATLEISPVLFRDEGKYYCTAKSNLLTAESNRATLYSEFFILLFSNNIGGYMAHLTYNLLCSFSIGECGSLS